MTANVENLTLTGTAAINGTGNTLANKLVGNDANNTLNGGTGIDTLMGGLGDDTYIVDNIADIVAENQGEGSDLVQSSVAYTLSANLENLILTGTAAINGTGNNLDNTLTGNSAANILDGGVGNDTMAGGAGNDTYVVDAAGDVVTELAASGTDTVQASITYALGAEVENLTLTGVAAINGTGNALANKLTGNNANNILDGGDGIDTLVGGLGDDTYFITSGDIVTEAANAGIDTVKADMTYTLGANLENLYLTGTDNINGAGNNLVNLLIGNSGDNILAGGLGNDTLTGGAGADQYVFNTALNGTTNKDTITDFSALDDTIVLENAIFTKFTTVGALSSGMFVSGAGATAMDANDYLVYNTTTGTLSYDADGNGAGAQVDIVTLTGIPALTSADFIII